MPGQSIAFQIYIAIYIIEFSGIKKKKAYKNLATSLVHSDCIPVMLIRQIYI